MVVAAWIGALTALLAATIALVQTDLKKILAYSTVSQLGYMVCAAGVGAYGAAMFHLVTHAFFKALLFLGAGSVMHATTASSTSAGWVACATRCRSTYITFLIGAAALAGIPLSRLFLQGRDAGGRPMRKSIPIYVRRRGHGAADGDLQLPCAFLTFHGEPRDQHIYSTCHESPLIMTVPLWILAFLIRHLRASSICPLCLRSSTGWSRLSGHARRDRPHR